MDSADVLDRQTWVPETEDFAIQIAWGKDWNEIAGKLSRLGHWGHEDYDA